MQEYGDVVKREMAISEWFVEEQKDENHGCRRKASFSKGMQQNRREVGIHMIVDINSKLDLLALDREINKFKGVNQKKPYLFVNVETAKAIEKEILPDWAYNLRKTTDTVVVGSKEELSKIGMICEYGSYKVFINEDLKFGEVELR